MNTAKFIASVTSPVSSYFCPNFTIFFRFRDGDFINNISIDRLIHLDKCGLIYCKRNPSHKGMKRFLKF
ncbi:hypothetical protein L1987_04276 [Smallanthus sonchifolius]|uniref:Uncharacterized protein n=1 Tax=Smallanthus sonchifolius TaxID=185202 RepID=A0ACB9KCZ5_9ASTR|nr:hypothetical protein L1987_04276 [Smallanthus sonchifolius]